VGWNGRNDHFINEISSLLARCPDMSNLHIDGPFWYGDGTIFGELFAGIDRLGLSLPLRRLELNGVALTSDDIASNLRHFRKIEFLGVSRNPNPLAESVLGQVCTILKEEDILLKGISTDFPDDPLLLDYLVSYSGLRELLFDPRCQSPDCPADLVERFYTQVLPSHHRTLEHLKFTCWPVPASFENDQTALDPLAEVTKCRSLRVLEVRYSGDGLRKDPGNFVSLLNLKFFGKVCSTRRVLKEDWLNACSQLQNLTQFNLYSYLGPSICSTLEWYRK
jgi:hypothetical protein